MLIIDAHNHFWQYDPVGYNWIGDDISFLRHDFLPQHLQPILQEHGVSGSIAVQARQSLEENEFLLRLAADSSFIRGVVGWVDLAAGDVEEALQQLAQYQKFVGIRHMVQSEIDDRFLLRKDFNRGVGLLKEYNLAYDILIHEQQLPATIKFVGRFPDQKFVLDHLAKPRIAAGVIRPWEQHIRELAKNPQVFCKLSGLVTEANWKSWQEADILPYLDVVFEAFGPDRLMFGSDWPVCLIAADYERVLQLVTRYIAQSELADQEKIMGLNALKFYGLE